MTPGSTAPGANRKQLPVQIYITQTEGLLQVSVLVEAPSVTPSTKLPRDNLVQAADRLGNWNVRPTAVETVRLYLLLGYSICKVKTTHE